MTAAGTLGLGSRARPKSSANALLGRPIDSTPSPTIQGSSNGGSRHGFRHLDDDGEDSSIQTGSESVAFTSDRSGFNGVVNCQSSGNGGLATRSSRRSKLVTPRSRTSRSTRQQAPYSSTTSRALMRARTQSDAIEDEDLLVSESTPDGDEQFARSIGERETVATMSGTLTSSNGDKKSMHAKHSPKDKSVEASNTAPKEPRGVTWGTWLKRLAPQSVTKTVNSIFGTPEPTGRKTKDIFLKTPKKEEDKPMSIPGNFEKSPKKDDPLYKNPNFLNSGSLRKTPIPNPAGLFTHSHPSSVSPPESSYPSTTTQKSLARRFAPDNRCHSPLSMVGSAQRSTNFIARMRSMGRTRRYDPYARPKSNTGTPVRRARATSRSPREDKKPSTAEEELELLKHRERDRNVQEAEDRYLRQEASKKLGRNGEEKERTVTDTAAATSPVKELNDDGQTSSTPAASPVTPPKSLATGKEISLEKLPIPQSPFKTPSSMESPGAGSDKKNLSGPPTPTMSHQKLPKQSLIPPPIPPPINDGSIPLSPEKPQPASGFVINQFSASTEPRPITRQHPMLDKHRPRVPSGLRNESSTFTNTKENNCNVDGRASPSSPGFKSGSKMSGGFRATLASSSSSTTGALRETQPNSITQAPKIDIRAKVAALPVKDLVELFSFPVVGSAKKGDTTKAARENWAPKGLRDWGKNLFAEAARNTTAVTV